MGIIKTLDGQPSYTLTNDMVRTAVTVQGGHLTASFKAGNRDINPFFIAPWWREQKYDVDEILGVLRGDFFCFPFGGGEDPYAKTTYPIHGDTACENWDFVDLARKSDESMLALRQGMRQEFAEIKKFIGLKKGEPVIYIDHLIDGFTGKMPLGNHPTLKLPDREWSGIVDISQPITGFTPTKYFEDPKAGGYIRMKPNTEVTDREKVPCLDGSTIDATRYPAPSGYEDLLMFISDPTLDFTFSAVSVPEEGYLYFQLKDPKVLAQTVFWMSNGGRYYPPWNGRCRSVLGIEEVTSFFNYGIKESVEKNLFTERGFKTVVDLHSDTPSHFKLIMGLVPIKKDFKGVRNIVKKDDLHVTIEGRGGEKIDVGCRVDFLKPSAGFISVFSEITENQ